MNDIEINANEVIFDRIHGNNGEYRTNVLVILLTQINELDFSFNYQFEWKSDEWIFENHKDDNDDKGTKENENGHQKDFE